MSTTTRLSIAAASAMLALASLAVGTNVHAAEQTQKADKSDPVGRCYGSNTCKGEGVLVKTRSACLAAGGTLTEPK